MLAAGEGSRLRPFTATKPKPMLRVANKPIAQHVLEALVAQGVKDVTFVLGYQRAKVQTYFGDGKKFGARIRYVFQEVLNGTAPAVALVPPPAGDFLVLGADNVIDTAAVKAALSAPPLTPSVVVHRSDEPSRYGVVTLEGERITRIEEKPRVARSNWVSTGIYRFPPEFHSRLVEAAKRAVDGIPDVLQEAIAQGVHVQALKSEALWSDAVYPWDLLRVHANLRGHARPSLVAPSVHVDEDVLVGSGVHAGPGTVLSLGTTVGNNVQIGPNCVIENCVLYDDVQVGAGSVLRNTVVGEGSRLGPRFTALSGPCDARIFEGWHRLEDFGSIIGEDCTVGGAVTMLPGSIVGNHVRIAPALVVRGAIEDGARIM